MSAPWPGPLGPPPDAAALVAAILALFAAVRGRRVYAMLMRPHRWVLLTALALAATALSAMYVQHYLRGGPRIIDATAYWLEARAMAEGHLTWPSDEPTAATRGRFLLLSGDAATPRLGVIFPPGYPAVLALGFAVGAPMWIGPLLAALLVVLTYALAREVAQRDDVARVAAALSVVSAALRYHTADTMSHGWAAALITATLLFLYRAVRGPEIASEQRATLTAGGAAAWVDAVMAGTAFGWLFATRPVSALALLPLVGIVVWRAPAPARVAIALAGGAWLPCALFAWQQHAVTGAILRSSQTAYYALADGPPGCFRYGFGQGIGCLHEHGAYVASVLPNGLDARAAAITTLRRLRLHLIDIANAEPLALLVLGAPFLARHAARKALSASPPDLHALRAAAARVTTLAWAPALLIGAYVPFYFDGSYPGGGARFFADIIPVEHVLIACALPPLAALLQRRASALDLARLASLVLGLAVGGFGVHAVFEHVALRDREGGRPFYEPAVLAAANIANGMLLVSTDHGFNLAHDPEARDPTRQLVVVRERGDDRDRLVWDKLGRPPAYRYTFEPTGAAVVRWWPPYPYDTPQAFRYEAEAEWPPLSQSGGFFQPVPARGTCAWGGALLAVHPAEGQPFRGSIAVPIPFPDRFRIGIHVASRGPALARFTLARSRDRVQVASWAFASERAELTCATLDEQDLDLDAPGVLEATVEGQSELWLDAIELRPMPGRAARRSAPPP